jgi:hypothetical protein
MVLNWIKSVLKTKPPPEVVTQDKGKTLIWGIVQGPIFASDIPDCDFPDEAVMVVAKVSEGSEVFDAEFWFDSFEDACVMVDYFKGSIDPIELDNNNNDKSKEP